MGVDGLGAWLKEQANEEITVKSEVFIDFPNYLQGVHSLLVDKEFIKTGTTSKEDAYMSICGRIKKDFEVLCRMTNPKKIYVCFEGPTGLATQVKKRNKNVKYFLKDEDEKYLRGNYYHTQDYSSGNSFVTRLETDLKRLIPEAYSQISSEDIVISGCNEEGEAETKCFRFLQQCPSEGVYYVVSGDSDSLLYGLRLGITHPNLTILSTEIEIKADMGLLFKKFSRESEEKNIKEDRVLELMMIAALTGTDVIPGQKRRIMLQDTLKCADFNSEDKRRFEFQGLHTALVNFQDSIFCNQELDWKKFANFLRMLSHAQTDSLQEKNNSPEMKTGQLNGDNTVKKEPTDSSPEKKISSEMSSDQSILHNIKALLKKCEAFGTNRAYYKYLIWLASKSTDVDELPKAKNLPDEELIEGMTDIMLSYIYGIVYSLEYFKELKVPSYTWIYKYFAPPYLSDLRVVIEHLHSIYGDNFYCKVCDELNGYDKSVTYNYSAAKTPNEDPKVMSSPAKPSNFENEKKVSQSNESDKGNSQPEEEKKSDPSPQNAKEENKEQADNANQGPWTRQKIYYWLNASSKPTYQANEEHSRFPEFVEKNKGANFWNYMSYPKTNIFRCGGSYLVTNIDLREYSRYYDDYLKERSNMKNEPIKIDSPEKASSSNPASDQTKSQDKFKFKGGGPPRFTNANKAKKD